MVDSISIKCVAYNLRCEKEALIQCGLILLPYEKCT